VLCQKLAKVLSRPRRSIDQRAEELPGAARRADPDRSASILDRIPAGRWGTPDDLRGIVVFLASAAAGVYARRNRAGGWRLAGTLRR
jgi:NAD(P)-dependent dehydrogenase (short-subunit alcohol dehydrogenase family)